MGEAGLEPARRKRHRIPGAGRLPLSPLPPQSFRVRYSPSEYRSLRPTVREAEAAALRNVSRVSQSPLFAHFRANDTSRFSPANSTTKRTCVRISCSGRNAVGLPCEACCGYRGDRGRVGGGCLCTSTAHLAEHHAPWLLSLRRPQLLDVDRAASVMGGPGGGADRCRRDRGSSGHPHNETPEFRKTLLGEIGEMGEDVTLS